MVRAGSTMAAAFDKEASHGTPFLFIPVFMGLGAVFYFSQPAEPTWITLLVLASVVFLVWRYRLSRGARAWLAGALLCAAAGALLAKAETERVRSVMLGGSVTTTIDMRVLRAERDGKQTKVLGEILATRDPQLKFQPELVRARFPAAWGNFAAGDVISGRFGLRPPGGPVRPGSYDFAFHSYFSRIGASGFAMGSIARIDGPPMTGAQRVRFALENIRADIAGKVHAAIPGTNGHVAAALIAGVTGGIDAINEEALRVTGLAHVLSISGLHMALVGGAVLFVVRFGFALFPAFAARRPVKKWAAGAALAASFVYLLLSGGAVATVRAFIMLAVMLVAIMLDRQALTLRNLAIAGIIILIVTPHEIMGPSFQMSFAATAALISAYGWISQWQMARHAARGDKAGRWPAVRAIAMASVLTPVVAGLATAIFSAWHFHRLAPMGLPANLLATPVISFVIMPFAMIGTLAMPFGLEEWPLKVMGYGVDVMLRIARWCAALSPADTVGSLMPGAFALLVLALLVLTLMHSRLRLLGLALVPAALMAQHAGQRPHLMVSEDGRLAAVVANDGALAVNRERPNAFTAGVWKNAAAAAVLVKPEYTKPANPAAVANNGGGTNGTGEATEPVSSATVQVLTNAASTEPGRFFCAPEICVASADPMAIVAWIDPAKFPPDMTSDRNAGNTGKVLQKLRNHNPDFPASRHFAEVFYSACDHADLVITASAIPYRSCGKGKAYLLRASDLARKGSAEIRFESSSMQPGQRSGPAGTRLPSDRLGQAFQIDITHAVGEPVRPWNRERVFSRAARNIPDYRSPKTARPPMPATGRKTDPAEPGDRKPATPNADFAPSDALPAIPEAENPIAE